jgi:hypothetical protein
MITIPSDGLTLDHDQLPGFVPSNPPDGADDNEQPEVDEDLFAGSPTFTHLDSVDVDLNMDDWMLDPEPDSGRDYGSEDEANIQRSGSESN